MTIDEAIAHAIEVAENNRINANSIESNMYIPLSVDKDKLVDDCIKCAEEHEQIAKWLEELKFYKEKDQKLIHLTEQEFADVYNKGRADAIKEYRKEMHDMIEGDEEFTE